MEIISSENHSFNMFLARKYGVDEAILIHHFQFWIRVNRFKKKNLIDGKCWTYQTREQIVERMPYWNVARVRYITQRLVDLGVLIVANHNKEKFDKTLWYAFKDERAFGVDEQASKFLYESENPQIPDNPPEIQEILTSDKILKSSDKILKPIPDTLNKDPKTLLVSKETSSYPPTPSKGKEHDDDPFRKELTKGLKDKEKVDRAIAFYAKNKAHIDETADNLFAYLVHAIKENWDKDENKFVKNEDKNREWANKIKGIGHRPDIAVLGDSIRFDGVGRLPDFFCFHKDPDFQQQVIGRLKLVGINVELD